MPDGELKGQAGTDNMKKLTHEPGEFRKADCYFAAYKTLERKAWDSENKKYKPTDWRLVHGVVNDKDGPFGHAWLENDDTIYDPMERRYIPKSDYIAANHVSRTIVYSFQAAVQHLNAHKTYGYWAPEFADLQHLPRTPDPNDAGEGAE